MPRRVAVIGSRRFPNPEVIVAYVSNLPADTILVSGGAEGTDTIAEQAARARSLSVEIYAADWEQLGRKAGPIRNQQIVEASDLVVAFWDGESRGTLNTVMRAVEAKREVRVFDPDGREVPIDDVAAAAEELGVLAAIRKMPATTS